MTTDEVKGELAGTDISERNISTIIYNDYNYFITIKPTYKSNKKKVTDNPELLLEILLNFFAKLSNYNILDSAYEYDSKDLPHLHIIINSPDSISRFIKKGWSIDLKVINSEDDMQNIKNYISKDKINTSEYAFID